LSWTKNDWFRVSQEHARHAVGGTTYYFSASDGSALRGFSDSVCTDVENL
jgi:hypothetical protein